jgi:plasmid stabilization system protein ParE
MLASFPNAGRSEGEIRVLVTVRPYVIRYIVRPEAVVILGVRHGARRP